MTTIPPVEIREVRRCDDCGFYYIPMGDEGDEHCQIEYPVSIERKKSRRNPIIPCIMNYTLEELQTLANGHNSGEHQPNEGCDTCTRYCDPRKPLYNPCHDYRPEQQPRKEGQ